MVTASILSSPARPAWLGRFGLVCQRELLFWQVIVQLVGGIYLQSQMAVYGGRVVVPNLIPKLVLFAYVMLSAAAFLLVRRGHVSARPFSFPQ